MPCFTCVVNTPLTQQTVKVWQQTLKFSQQTFKSLVQMSTIQTSKTQSLNNELKKKNVCHKIRLKSTSLKNIFNMRLSGDVSLYLSYLKRVWQRDNTTKNNIIFNHEIRNHIDKYALKTNSHHLGKKMLMIKKKETETYHLSLCVCAFS